MTRRVRNWVVPPVDDYRRVRLHVSPEMLGTSSDDDEDRASSEVSDVKCEAENAQAPKVASADATGDGTASVFSEEGDVSGDVATKDPFRDFMAAYKKARSAFLEALRQLDPEIEMTMDGLKQSNTLFSKARAIYDAIPETEEAVSETSVISGQAYANIGKYLKCVQTFFNEFPGTKV